MDWGQLGALLGGIGLLLLGMNLMTDGLRLAAGQSLLQLLENSTRTPRRGLLSGFLLTTTVQSSSAVTAATIGFANAGILKLKQAAWIIYGSNVGTTMTGWLVALIGVNFKIEAFALPMIGIGMALKLLKGREWLGGAGGALTGFGTLFLGISFLKHAMQANAGLLDLNQLQSLGPAGVAAGVFAGALMTTLMQSSSAVLAIVLTASASQVISLPLGAALVIGANIGTTSTALLSVIGATANAKRLACLHMIFNLVTGVAALLLLWPILWLLAWLMNLLGAAPIPASQLALFHTIFNALGVALIWHPTPYILRWLKHRFVEPAAFRFKPRFIDTTVLPIPALAINALYYELVNVSGLLRLESRQLADSFAGTAQPTDAGSGLQKLLHKTARFAARLGRENLPQQSASDLLALTRVNQNFLAVLQDITDIRHAAKKHGRYPQFGMEYMDALRNFIASADMGASDFSMPETHRLNKVLTAARQAQSQRLLSEGLSGAEDMADVSEVLQQLNRLQRLCDQLHRAIQLLSRFGSSHKLPPVPEEDAELHAAAANP